MTLAAGGCAATPKTSRLAPNGFQSAFPGRCGRAIGSAHKRHTPCHAKTADAAVAPAEVAPAHSRPFGFTHFTVFGRLAADAELRFSGNGNPVTRVPLAVNDRAGHVHYLDVIVFGESAKVLGQ